MKSVAVDTDVVSFLFKNDTRALAYLPHLSGRRRVLSFMTLAELDAWSLTHRWGATRKARMERYLQQFTIHPFNRLLCQQWAELTVDARRAGRQVQVADAWIAATALQLSIPLVTHNADDYVGIPGLVVLTQTV